MANFIEVPVDRLQPEILQSLLEEYSSRDGTDYGEREVSLAEKVSQLLEQLKRGDLRILYDADCEQWDVLPRQDAADLLLHPWVGETDES